MIDGAPAAPPAFFTIDFSTVSTLSSAFYIYISTDSLNNINSTAGDIRMVGPISNGFLSNSTVGTTAYTSALGTWHVGYDGAEHVIVGPIPIDISTSFNYIKLYDGSCGTNPAFCGVGVGVSLQSIVVQAGLTLTPTSGPAGITVTANGGGFPSSKTIDLTFSYTVTFYNNTVSSAHVGNWTTNLSTGPGFFSFSGAMLNVKQQILDLAGDNLTYSAITISASRQAPTPHTVYATALFNENSAFISEAVSLDTMGTVLAGSNAFALSAGYGSQNATAFDIYSPLTVPDAVYHGILVIAGNDSAVNSAVTVWVGGHLNTAKTGVVGATQIGSATSDSSGNFNTTNTIVLGTLSLGLHLVTINVAGTLYWFHINVIPSITLSPTHGPVGTFVVVTAFGFPADSIVWIYWDELAWGDGHAVNLANGTIGTNGVFTGSVNFTVPQHTFGVLPHVVYAVDNVTVAFPGASALNTTIAGEYEAATHFTVTSTFTLSPTSTPDNGTMVTGTATGLIPGCTRSGFENYLDVSCYDLQQALTNAGTPAPPFYALGLDNGPLVTSAVNVGSAYAGIMANGTGDLTVSFPAAGLRPGLHVVSLDNGYGGHMLLQVQDNFEFPTPNVYSPTLMAFFNITTAGDPIYMAITGLTSGITTAISNSQTAITLAITGSQDALMTAITASQTAITTAISNSQTAITTAISNSQTAITTAISNSQTALMTAISNSQTAITTAISNAQGAITTAISSAQSTLAGDITTAQGHITDAITAATSTLAGDISSATTAAQSAATQAQNAVSAANNAVSGGNTSQNYVLVVAVLAAITLVLELAILVRKLS
jgi:hypothetical protein